MRLFGKNTDTDLIVVAEIGVNHEGSVERATYLITEAHEAGADAVKIQVGTVTGGPERKGKSYALDEPQVRELARRCKMLKIPLFASAADCVLEMVDADGARLRIELRGSAAAHCQTLAQALWSVAR